MNSVYEAGGWKGRKPDWDTDEEVIAVRPGYDRQRQAQAMSDMDTFVERTKEAVMQNTLASNDDESEWDGVVDKEWREAE